MKNTRDNGLEFKLRPGPAHHASGFSLIEALVALLVLSVGLLGLAALQTVGMRFNQASYLRTQAVFQAYDIADRIRANPTAKTAGRYDAIAATDAPPNVTQNCATSICDTDQMATYDINKWKTATANLLPGGTGAISTSGTRRTITIGWIEDDKKANYVLQIDL